MALQLRQMRQISDRLYQLQQQTSWSGRPGRQVHHRISSGEPSCTTWTQHAAWQAANGGCATKTLHGRVAMNQQPNVQHCWGLTVVAGCHGLKDRRKERCNNPTGCEQEHRDVSLLPEFHGGMIAESVILFLESLKRSCCCRDKSTFTIQ